MDSYGDVSRFSGTPDATIWAPNCVSVDTPVHSGWYQLIPVLQCYNCPPIISVEFVKVKLRIPGGHGNPEEGEHRKSFTVHFFGFMLVGLPLEASKNRVSTCFYMEYAQSSHPSTWSTNENKKVDESQVEEAVAYAKRPCLCLSPGGLRKCILSILINSTGLMVFLMGWHKSYPTSQYVYWKVLKVASSLGQLL